MNDDEPHTETLFSYGTLRQEDVQLAVFGRRLAFRPDALVGYALKVIQIQDRSFAAKNGAHQRTLHFTGNASDLVEGVALTLTRQELEQADDYEPDDYERVRVQLRSGFDAWLYLQTGQ
jgi:Gamma-glutamyl cyclotransferase, AIG2-like